MDTYSRKVAILYFTHYEKELKTYRQIGQIGQI